MVNTCEKGRKAELLCARELEKQGYRIVFRSVRTRFGCVDFADLFDVVGVRDNTMEIAIPQQRTPCEFKTIFYPSTWKFISVKHNQRNRKHEEEILEFKKKYTIDFLCNFQQDFLTSKLFEFEVWYFINSRWRGGKKNKHYEKAHWEVVEIV